MLKEFREFIAKGNVLDLAVAVLIGLAFGKIITSFTTDILTPIIGAFGKADFSALAINVGNANIAYGKFINSVIDFLIVAWVLFIVVKAANKGKKPVEAPATPAMKDCPFCLTSIPASAKRCAACTSEV
jgi:large conductance mechanosensitive channel